jgi:ribonuclease T2
MRRGDVTVLSISAALAAVVVAAVTYSTVVLDRTPNPSALVTDGTASSWLVLTWAPSFCTVDPSNAACASGDVNTMGETLILHGLWPQPPDRQYCAGSHDEEHKLPPVDLSGRVRASLASTMVNEESLVHHEWYAHGTCAGVSPDTYFGDATLLTNNFREVLDPVFRAAAGGRLTLGAVRDRVETAFGAGIGDRVGFGCRKATGEGSIIVEVRVSLPPVVALRDSDGLISPGELLEESPPMSPQCRHGSVP